MIIERKQIIKRNSSNQTVAVNNSNSEIRLTRFVSQTQTTPILILSSQSSGSWTDLDLTSVTSSNAYAVSIALLVRDSNSSSSVASLGVRKNGETDGDQSFFVVTGAIDDRYYENDVICGVDTGQILEYLVTATGSGTTDVIMRIIGYWEYID